MAKRDLSTKTTKTKTQGMVRTSAAGAAPMPDANEQRVVAFAEQLGRMVGTVQAKADGWFDREALSAQISSIRDSAADLLEKLAPGGTRNADAAPARATANNQQGRSGGVVDAPGKRHRKPIPNPVGVKASDTRIAKVKLSNESRRRSRG